MNPVAPSPSIAAPSLALFGAEPLRAAIEYAGARLLPRRFEARGDGHPVVFFPGLASDGLALTQWKKMCESFGVKAFDWGRGINTGPTGDVSDWLAALADEIAHRLAPHGERASLVGWSLGGIYAREVARRHPKLVRQVISVGTPFAGGVEQTRAGWVYRLLNRQPSAIDTALLARLRSCPPVPTTAIYSRSDGVVAWQAARQCDGAGCFENVEVRGSHLGLGWNAQVCEVVIDRLAQPEGCWQPYALSRAAGEALQAHQGRRDVGPVAC